MASFGNCTSSLIAAVTRLAISFLRSCGCPLSSWMLTNGMVFSLWVVRIVTYALCGKGNQWCSSDFWRQRWRVVAVRTLRNAVPARQVSALGRGPLLTRPGLTVLGQKVRSAPADHLFGGDDQGRPGSEKLQALSVCLHGKKGRSDDRGERQIAEAGQWRIVRID